MPLRSRLSILTALPFVDQAAGIAPTFDDGLDLKKAAEFAVRNDRLLK